MPKHHEIMYYFNCVDKEMKFLKVTFWCEIFLRTMVNICLYLLMHELEMSHIEKIKLVEN